MAERRFKRRSTIFSNVVLAIIQALKKLDGTGTNREVNELVFEYIQRGKPSEEEQSQRISDEERKKIKTYLGWTRTYLKMSGDLKWVSHGVWKLTEAGYKIHTLEDATNALKRYDKAQAEKSFGKISIPNELPEQDQETTQSKKRNFIITPDETPDISGIMLAIIIALDNINGLGTIHDINARVIKDEEIEEAEQSYPLTADGNRPKLDYYLSWARTYLKIIGALENPARGVWMLTDVGSKICTPADAKKAFNTCFEKIEQRRDTEPQNISTRNSLDIIRYEKQPDETINPDDDAWKFVLLKILHEMDPHAFEHLCKILLDAVGFNNVKVSKKGADGGIDGVGFLRINLISFKVCFQCKRTSGKVSVDKIRDFRGALAGRTDKGLFFTTSTFTSHSEAEAIRYGMILIDLIDGEEICNLLKEHKIGVETSLDGQIITINPDYFNSILTPTPKKETQK